MLSVRVTHFIYSSDPEAIFQEPCNEKDFLAGGVKSVGVEVSFCLEN